MLQKQQMGMHHHEHGEGDYLLSSSHEDHSMRIYGQALDFHLIDEKMNLKTVLKMYDNMYWIFSEKGIYPSLDFAQKFHPSRLLGRTWKGEGRIPREHILETGCLDWCVGYAFSNVNDHVGKVSGSNNNQILVSALLLAVTADAYMNPPSLDDETFQVIVGALLGVATFIQLFNLAAYIAVSNLINEPYMPSLSMFARCEADFYMRFLSYMVYLGVAAFVAALIFMAYVGNIIDLYVLLPLVLPLIVYFGIILYYTTESGAELRRETVFQFYEVRAPSSPSPLPSLSPLPSPLSSPLPSFRSPLPSSRPSTYLASIRLTHSSTTATSPLSRTDPRPSAKRTAG